ncbi:hypothetical protein GF312_10635 [Candidatus Poribacteria bacterium]|nr:hypothetical protein [Candidatus Poribacteria bacterium]
MTKMTMRERMLALVRGQEHDRVPFVEYSGISGASNEDVWSVIGRENMGLLAWVGLHRFKHPNCRFESEEIVVDGRKGTRVTLHTPEGSLTDERLGAAISSASYKHYITEPEDYKILLSYLRDITVHKHTDQWEAVYKRMGDDGLPHTSIGRTPYQQLWIQWVSLEDLALHMVDCPELMEEVFDALFEVQRGIFRAVRKAVDELPVPYVNFGDNITAPMIGENYFRKYCVTSYQEMAEMLEGTDIIIAVHMDGDLKPLWKAIAESPVRLLDSFSPAPDNDTSVADAVREWPEMRLCLNYPSSIHLAEPEVIYNTTMEMLEQGGHTGRLQIQISENMPPGVWKKSYPQIVKAINDFGPIKG